MAVDVTPLDHRMLELATRFSAVPSQFKRPSSGLKYIKNLHCLDENMDLVPTPKIQNVQIKIYGFVSIVSLSEILYVLITKSLTFSYGANGKRSDQAAA